MPWNDIHGVLLSSYGTTRSERAVPAGTVVPAGVWGWVRLGGRKGLKKAARESILNGITSPNARRSLPDDTTDTDSEGALVLASPWSVPPPYPRRTT